MLRSIQLSSGEEIETGSVPHPPSRSRFMASLVELPRPLVAATITVLTLLIGWADYASGWELSLFIFYAVPIITAVWTLGTRAGLAAAILSSLVWLYANEASNPYETTLGYVWAMISRFFYFGVVVFAVAVVRSKQQADAAHIQMLEEQRILELEIVGVSEHEQQRIGQDLHDGICQQLAAIGCAARVLSDDLQAKNSPEARDAALIEESIQKAVVEARNLARGIFPVHVDRIGLAAALTDLASTMSRLTGIPVELINCDEVNIFSHEVSKHLYRIAQESVANALRHSEATRITLSLKLIDDALELRVEDDGIGLPSLKMARNEGMGLRTMRYRARAVGSTLETGHRPGGGTAVVCRLKPQHYQK